MIDKYINELLHYGASHGLVEADDMVYAANRLLEALSLEQFEQKNIDGLPLPDILEALTEDAISRGLIEDTGENRDLFDTKLMGCLTPPPSTVRRIFNEKLAHSPKEATDWYYDFSQATNYIRKDRIAKDVKWTTDTPFGTLDITINCSKPEKDPRDIALAKTQKQSEYPKCLLCMENEGYAGHLGHAARQNHRILPLRLDGDDFFLQYSPYVYYNEHCIILDREHRPMKIDGKTFRRLLDFVDQFPHYMVGSNTDLPIVGGSILSHEHFQGGNYEFPYFRAPLSERYQFADFPQVTCGIVHWSMSAIRLESTDRKALETLGEMILDAWRAYSDPDCMIIAHSDGEQHNTITPLVRLVDGVYELDLVLRNNITTEEHPMGLFHPHEEYHYVKKENIGLIEVMGLAILPKRLMEQMDISKPEVREEIGTVFGKVLECAGVYKWDQEGRDGFHRFMDAIGAERQE